MGISVSITCPAWFANKAGRAVPGLPPGAAGLGESSTWLPGCGIKEGNARLPGCGVRSGLQLVPQVCAIWGGFQDGDLPEARPPATRHRQGAPQLGTHPPGPGARNCPPEAADHLPVSFRCAIDEKCAKAHLRPSARTLTDPGAHPRARPSLRRGSGGRAWFCEITRRPSPAGHTAPAPSPSPTPVPAPHLELARPPSLSGTWNMSPAAPCLVVCRAAVPARQRAARGSPARA